MHIYKHLLHADLLNTHITYVSHPPHIPHPTPTHTLTQTYHRMVLYWYPRMTKTKLDSYHFFNLPYFLSQVVVGYTEMSP